MGSILRPTKIANFFHHLCDAITDVIFLCVSMRILDETFLKKKRSIRCDFDPCNKVTAGRAFTEIIYYRLSLALKTVLIYRLPISLLQYILLSPINYRAKQLFMHPV